MPPGCPSLGRRGQGDLLFSPQALLARMECWLPLLTAVVANAAGQVADQSDLAGDPLRRAPRHALLWDQGVMMDLGFPSDDSNARAINALGAVVGSGLVRESRRDEWHTFLWQDGVTTALSAEEPGLTSHFAVDLNDAGQVVGFVGGVDWARAVLWQGGKRTDLDVPDGYPSSQAVAINAAGQIVIAAVRVLGPFLSPRRAFLWDLGVLADLGVLPGFDYAAPCAINAAGQVVGYVLNGEEGAASTVTRAVLWQQGQVADLGRLIPPNSAWQLREAHAINDAGHIVGAGIVNGQPRAFLLTPLSGGLPWSGGGAAAASGILGLAGLGIAGLGVALRVRSRER